MHIGQPDTATVKCLINTISRFIDLVSCQTLKPMPCQKNCNNIVGALKCLKPVLDDVADCKISLDDDLCKQCEELDREVNESRESLESSWQKMSKIHRVLCSGALLMKIRSSSLDIFRMISRSLQSSLSTSVSASLEPYMQEIQCLKKEPATIYIEEALRNQRENITSCNEHLRKIIDLLGLTSSQELLKESIAVEKERMNAGGELDEINQIVNLVCNIRGYVMKTQHLEVKSGVSVPPFFRCPLSLELMLDPVIVASGQTYERLSIQKWLDYGLTVCPKTRQKLSHANLITNYTVKAMISSWCEENNVKLTYNSKRNDSVGITSPLDHLCHEDLACTHCFGSLHSSDSTSRSPLKTGNAPEKQKGDISPRSSGGTEKFEQQSSAPSSIYGRSESFSSSISSSDYVHPNPKEVSEISIKHDNTNESGEITDVYPASPANELGISPRLSGKQIQSPRPKMDEIDGGNKNNHSVRHPLPVFYSGSDELTISHVNKLIEDLRSQSTEVQTRAAEELRLLTKNNMENRIIIGQCGAIAPLLSLLYSDMKTTQEHAVTALLNLSINQDNKALIAEAGAIEPLIYVLKTGSDGAKENSAAALFSLSVIENNKAKIGRSGAVKALVDLLGSGTLRGKKDAATALFNLSIFHENKARIVQAGAVKYLVQLMESAEGMVDKAVALLANLSTIAEGKLAIAREGGIPLLVEIVESGSQRGKENAASVLLQLCLHSPKFCTLVLQEGAVPPLVALSQSGTPRAKEKAQQLLSHFRNLREAKSGKGKS